VVSKLVWLRAMETEISAAHWAHAAWEGLCVLFWLYVAAILRGKASILWSHHEETRELPGERDNARNNARCTQARKDNIKTWTGLSVEESIRVFIIRLTEDRDKWRKYVHGVANPRIEDG